jgi:hypothetical protein
MELSGRVDHSVGVLYIGAWRGSCCSQLTLARVRGIARDWLKIDGKWLLGMGWGVQLCSVRNAKDF